MLALGISALLLLVLAALAKAAVDIMVHQEDNNIFMNWGAWWDNRVSWKRKYRNYDAGDLRPRFWKSTTWLVFLVDFWHLADCVYLTAYYLGAALAGIGSYLAFGPMGVAGSLAANKAVFGGVFELAYQRWFRIKK